MKYSFDMTRRRLWKHPTVEFLMKQAESAPVLGSIIKIVAILYGILGIIRRHHIQKLVGYSLLLAILVAIAPLVYIKAFQRWDQDSDRGAIGISNGAYGESYSTPRYLEQGWNKSDSLWFYNTSMGSTLLPFDLFMVLKDEDGKLFRSNENVDKFRYLPQKATFLNPDALPVGFVKATYQGKDYIGYTCAACHTAQINFTEKGSNVAKAIRIDGGPAMADLVGFLTALEMALEATQKDPNRRKELVADVLTLKNNYSSEKEVIRDVERWHNSVQRYNIINHSETKYGHARLDALGRIYTRVAQSAIGGSQLRTLLALTGWSDEFLLTTANIEKITEGIGDKIFLTNEEFSIVVARLLSTEPGYPGISMAHFLRARNAIFNPPNAPVSYPPLWDVTHSDYVQWNGSASNVGAGPLRRSAGEVIGAFGVLDLRVNDSALSFDLGALVSGQYNKRVMVGFESSIDLFNLQRLNSHLSTLKSPQWPFCKNTQGEYYLPDTAYEPIFPGDAEYCKGSGARFDEQSLRRGAWLYADRCQSCHAIVNRSAWDRLAVGKIYGVDRIGTDPVMAKNSADYFGKSGPFKDTYQLSDIGNVIVEDDAVLAELLAAMTNGITATPDREKWFLRRWLELLYVRVMSIADNKIRPSLKRGQYDSDTPSDPYASMRSYRARPLNGIWATAPYLHNGSVPSLRELLKRPRDRTTSFNVGAREFDPVNVGFVNKGTDFGKVTDPGNSNGGHDYFCKRKRKAEPRVLFGVQRSVAGEEMEEVDCMTENQIDDLLEYLRYL